MLHPVGQGGSGPPSLSPWVLPTPWDEEAAGAQAAVAHTAGVAVPVTGKHSQDTAELVGEVSIGQDGAGVESGAWWHLLAIPQPRHADGPWVEAGDAANQQELGWAGRAGEDCGQGRLWKARAKGLGSPGGTMLGPSVWGICGGHARVRVVSPCLSRAAFPWCNNTSMLSMQVSLKRTSSSSLKAV